MAENKKGRKVGRSNEVVIDYWLRHYVNQHCTLCGNSGIIDTRRTARTAAGIMTGRENFCICPNGQSMREHGAIVGGVVAIS